MGNDSNTRLIRFARHSLSPIAVSVPTSAISKGLLRTQTEFCGCRSCHDFLRHSFHPRRSQEHGRLSQHGRTTSSPHQEQETSARLILASSCPKQDRPSGQAHIPSPRRSPVASPRHDKHAPPSSHGRALPPQQCLQLIDSCMCLACDSLHHYSTPCYKTWLPAPLAPSPYQPPARDSRHGRGTLT